VRAVIVHPAFLGDTVFLGPAVRALKARWPEGRVAICTTPRGAPVARLLPGCDEVLVFDKRRADRGIFGLLRAGRRLRAFAPDLALVSHYSLRSGALAWLSGARRRIGYASLFCTERVRLDRTRPFVERALRLAGLAGAPIDDRTLALTAPEECRTYADHLLRCVNGPIAGLVPGAEWETKRWGEERWGAVASELHQRGFTLVILGGPAERPLAARIRELAGVPTIDTTGNSIPEAIALLARCDLVVGGDTGLVHCARALSRRTVILFGPTDPARHVFSAREAPVQLRLECQPCHGHGPARCPLGHHHCMALLDPATVAGTARTLLDQSAS
jgi:lipopolysaccharide heptosyltransferase II